jgi:hypothetical protein
MMPPITALHTHGLNQEIALLPRLEEYFGELCKTTERFAQYDYFNREYNIELKSRRKYDNRGNLLLPTTYDTWLLPCSKKPKDKPEATFGKKDTVFVYHFEGDNSLWYLVYDDELFASFDTERPFWHPTKQEHYQTPSSVWTKFE